VKGRPSDTDQKRRQGSSSAETESYRLLFEKNPLPMWVFDLETLRFLDVNDAAVEKYGYSRSEFLSMTLEDIRLQEDAPRLREALRVLRPNDRMIGLWRHRKKDGTTFDVEVLSSEVTILTRRARLALINDVRSEERRVGKDGRHRWWR